MLIRRTLLLLALVSITHCQNRPGEPSLNEPVTLENAQVPVSLGEEFTVSPPFMGITQDTAYLQELTRLPSPLNVSTESFELPASLSRSGNASGSLVLSYPQRLIGKMQVFGGVITTVSDKTNENLGRLKLTNLPSLHVYPVVVEESEDKFTLVFTGCPSKCTPSSEKVALFGVPIIGADVCNKTIQLDLSALGSQLDFIRQTSDGTKTLEVVSSQVDYFDYSQSTLVFDVAMKLQPTGFYFFPFAKPTTLVKVRWFLKPGQDFTPQFTHRLPTPGVGFFQTLRSAEAKIIHFPQTAPNSILYYVKNVPLQFQASFTKAFEEWNQIFEDEAGSPLLSHVFVKSGTPLGDRITTGDVRYRVVEWDENNLAPYGGLGPAVANQETGEILSANVLIQGPKIVEIYTKWFQTGTQSQRWVERGWTSPAEAKRARQLLWASQQPTETSETVKPFLGNLEWVIPAELPEYQDPIMRREDFDHLPQGMDFTQYMDGYFQEIVAHELGHNVGLRHNFRGNLTATDEPIAGEVSSSVMEYLGRKHRHLNRIAHYDRMAIRYGYAGVLPDDLSLFCTDEDVIVAGSKSSPECSRDDATSDPFSYFVSQLDHGIGLLLNRGETTAGDWEVGDMETPLQAATKGIAFYGNLERVEEWTNFFNLPGRPKDGSTVQEYVWNELEATFCDSNLDHEALNKGSSKEVDRSKKKLLYLRKSANTWIQSTQVFSTSLSCL